MTAPISLLVQRIRGKLKDWRDTSIVFVSIFVFIAIGLAVVTAPPRRPHLAGSIDGVLTVPSGNGRDITQFITINIENKGDAQSAAKKWSAEAVIGGTTVIGEVNLIPESLPINLFEPGPNDPEQIVFHKADDVVRKSMETIQSGAITVGVLYVKFKNLDAATFRNGGITTVRYEDVFSRKYSAQITMTARNHTINRSPGLTTDLVCRQNRSQPALPIPR